jgi:hypothetical protein
MDKQIGEKDKISGRWSLSENETVQPFGTASTLPFEKTCRESTGS